MAVKKKKRTVKKSQPRGMKAVLEATAKRLSGAKALREGTIAFRLTGPGRGEFSLDCTAKGVRLATGMPRRAESPLIEVMGNGNVIAEILEGKTDPLSQFLRGRLRVRGDLAYLSDLLLEFGMIKEPL